MKAASYVRLAAVLLMPALVEAQVVRGAVIDRGTDAPLAGTLVLLVDSAGTIARRALTDDAGEYRLHAPAAGTYRVRTLRIGFRPVTSDPFTLWS